MTSFARIWGFTLAEMRHSRRLARTWLFIVAGFLISLPALGGMAFNFYNLSGFDPFFALVNNVRYMFAAQIGGTLILVYSIGIVFLAFDAKVRDKSARMHEVLESRPIDNFGFLLGRTLGITLIATIPILITVILALIIAALTQFNTAFQIGLPQPQSLWQFILIDLLPNLFFYTAVIVFYAMLLRYRLLVILAGIGTSVFFFYLSTAIPYEFIDVLTWLSSQEFPSDVAPFFTNMLTLIERLALVLLGVGLLFFAALLQPRLDGNVFLQRTSMGFGTVVLALLGFFLIYLNSDTQSSSRETWQSAHAELDRTMPTPLLDVSKLGGSVVVKPGSNLTVAYEIEAEVIGDNGSKGMMFSFNPGYEDLKVLLNGTATTDFTFENGLLHIAPNTVFDRGSSQYVSISANGVPDGLFEYLDSGIDLYKGTIFKGLNLRLLGQANLIFDSDFVALTPDAAWYPVEGPNVHRDQITRRPRDFFELNLRVDVPSGWIVAGPRDELTSVESDVVSYQLNPSVSVPFVTLVADEFHRVATEIKGITFELLVHPKHTENLALFDDVGPEIRENIEMHVNRAERFGLRYPYNTLSLVEVPSSLKIFGGGWRMDTIQSQPGVLYMKELSFPTASFVKQTDFRTRTEWDEFRRREYKFALLESFLRNDLLGGNVFLGFVRNLFVFQTGATGPGAEALDFLTECLVNRLVVDDDGFFSAYMIADASSASQGALVMGSTQTAFLQRNPDPQVSSGKARAFTFERNSTWESALDHPLSALPFSEDPETALKVLELKGLNLARAIIDGVGREPAGMVLRRVISEYSGKSYSYADLQRISSELDVPIDQVVGDWLNDIELPGYLVSRATVVRINDDESEFPRYLTSFHIRNGERAPGVATVKYVVNPQAEESESTSVITLQGEAAIQVNLVTTEPIRDIQVQSYLSMNRQPISVRLPRVADNQKLTRVETEPPAQLVPSTWIPEDRMGIIVDDLDEGFSTDNPHTQIDLSWLPAFFRNFIPSPDVDHDLPVYNSGPHGVVWAREARDGAFGTYRNTTARIHGLQGVGEGISAYFSTQIPNAGTWQLDYHIPVRVAGGGRRGELKKAMMGKRDDVGEQGDYSLTLQFLDEEKTIEFDAAAGNYGWNNLGIFELPSAKVTIKVSQASEGDTLFADAIRWVQKSAS